MKISHIPIRLIVFFVSIAGLLFWMTPSVARSPAPVQDSPVALSGGDIFTADGTRIENGTVLFDRGKIVAIGKNISIPDGTEVIDVTGKQVHPGLILSRTTLGLTEIGRHAESTDLSETGEINPNIRPQVAFHSASEHIGVAAVHGVTTAILMPTGGIITGQAAAMMTDGWTWEQMTLRAPLGLVIHWPGLRQADAYDKALSSLQHAFDQARRYLLAREAAGPDDQLVYPADLRWEAMIPVLKGELPVFVMANDIAQIQAALGWTEKEKLRMVLVGGRDAGYIADQLVAKKVPVMVTPVIAGPARPWEPYNQAYELPWQLHQAGVTFCIAGEASAAGAYRLAQHAAAAVAFGLPQEEALKAITHNAAAILGIDDQVGSLEAGKDATIIVTSGNPLETMSTTDMVFIQGRRIDQTDKHRRLYDLYMEKHKQSNP